MSSAIADRSRRHKALHREGRSATTGTGGIRIIDHETRADQLFAEIDDRLGQKRQRHRVYHNLFAFAFKHEVIVGRVVEPDIVLKARASQNIKEKRLTQSNLGVLYQALANGVAAKSTARFDHS